MSKRGGLGKGLGAIFGENPNPVPEPVKEIQEQNQKQALDVDIASIKPNPYQPRRVFDTEKLQELAASIKEFGVVQPLVVRKKGQGYELVALSGRFFPLLTLYYYILSCLRIRNACSCDLLIKDYSELSDSSFLISSISGSDLRILSSISAVVL